MDLAKWTSLVTLLVMGGEKGAGFIGIAIRPEDESLRYPWEEKQRSSKEAGGSLKGQGRWY